MFAVMPPIQRKSRPARIAGEKARKEVFNKYFKPAVAAAADFRKASTTAKAVL